MKSNYPAIFSIFLTLVFILGELLLFGNEFNYFQTYFQTMMVYIGGLIVGELTLMNNKPNV